MTTSEYFHYSLFGYRFPRYRPHLQWICMPKVLFVEVLQFLPSNFSMKLNDLTPIWVLCLAETNNNQLLCSLDPSTWYHYQCNFFLFHFINQLLSIFNFIAQDILLCRRWTSVSPSGVSFSSCQWILIKTFQIEGMIALITKMHLIFSWDLLNGQK